jgi:hypothetical protein
MIIQCGFQHAAQQLSLQSLHRMRQRLMLERTVKSNQIRSMFAEERLVSPISIITRGGVSVTPSATQSPPLRRSCVNSARCTRNNAPHWKVDWLS